MERLALHNTLDIDKKGMMIMKESMRITRKIYLHSMRFLCPLFAVYAATVAFLCSINGKKTEWIHLTTAMQLGLMGMLFFAVTTYELLSLSRRAGAAELLTAQENTAQKLSLAQLLVQLILLSAWALLVMVWCLVWYFLRGSVFATYCWHLVKTVVLYCFFPGLLGILLGGALSRINRPVSYGIIILATILCSSIPAKMYSWSEIGARLTDWFHLGVPNSNWVTDSQYGIGLERSRWILVAFWSFFLAAGVLCAIKTQWTKKNKGALAALLILALVCGIAFANRHDQYILYKDDRPDAVWKAEADYRKQELNDTVPCEGDYEIQSYDLAFKIGANLKCNAVLHFGENTLSEYSLTLYHGYEVTRICDLNGKILRYDRSGDHITIYADSPLKGVQLDYKGNGGKYYANDQAIALPGYFAYYPMPGHLELWNDQNKSFAPITDLPQAEFHVSVDSSLQVYSNLPVQEKNTFCGTSNGVTLFAGILHTTKIDDIQYCVSPLEERTVGISKKELEEEWAYIADVLDLDVELSLKGKTVFYLPMTFFSNFSSNEGMVMMDDQMFIGSVVDTGRMCSRYLESFLPAQEETELLRTAFCDYFKSKPTQTVEEKPYKFNLKILLREDLSDLDDEEMMQYIYAEEEYADLLLYQVQQLGESYTLQRVYEYLTAETHDENQVDFLYNLGVTENGED